MINLESLKKATEYCLFDKEQISEFNFSDFKGKTVIAVYGAEQYSELLAFECDDGNLYVMSHVQDCCETVSIEDINGDVNCLIGTPITMSDVSSIEEEENDEHEHMTWTFYRLATIRGYVDIRWCGCSNGYYSEEVGCFVTPKKYYEEAKK